MRSFRRGLSSSRVAALVLVATVAFVSSLAAAKPTHAPTKPAKGAPSASASVSASHAPTALPQPTVDYWQGAPPPPERPPPAAAEAPKPPLELAPAAPSEDATRNAKYFAGAVIAVGLFCVLIAVSRSLADKKY